MFKFPVREISAVDVYVLEKAVEEFSVKFLTPEMLPSRVVASPVYIVRS
jgi:hypothetical protein